MEDLGASQSNPATPGRLVHELQSMRDAAVRLSLALADYHFHVASDPQSEAARELAELLAKVKAVALK